MENKCNKIFFEDALKEGGVYNVFYADGEQDSRLLDLDYGVWRHSNFDKGESPISFEKIKFLLMNSKLKKVKQTHEIKIEPVYFDKVLNNVKKFEIRKNDRNYKVGDIVHLKEWKYNEPTNKSVYTTRVLKKVITYITDYAQREGYVVFGIEDIK